LEFILLFCGLVLGVLGGVNWSRAQNTNQIKSILKILDDGEPDPVSLPLESRLRRTAMGVSQGQQDLKNQLQTWDNILQAAPIGYLHLAEDNQILWCNSRARELLQIQQWQPERPRVLLEIVRSYELDRAILQTRKERVNQQMEWQFHPSYTDNPSVDTEAIALKASLIALPDREVGVFLENRQQTVELNQARERWATDLAHELRTPLTSIRLTAETLQMKVEPSASRWLDRMLQEVERLTRLVQDFMDLSHLEENPSQYVLPRLIRLADIVNNAWQSVEGLAGQRQVSLLQEGDFAVTLEADASRLTQVLINLFDNAIRYSPAQSSILLVAKTVPHRIELDVIDSGQGFAPQDLPHVFDRLFRGDLSRQHDRTDSTTAGNGLGLAIVRQIIRAHQGTITAQNHPVTNGGWIAISLPQQLPTP
jgi:two-component system, OmpR family, phosphate regulon sensor histidine kinase PhoR